MSPRIAVVIEKHAGQDEKVVRQALREAWDKAGMGSRTMHPYKVWCDEIRRQLAARSAGRRWLTEKAKKAIRRSFYVLIDSKLSPQAQARVMGEHACALLELEDVQRRAGWWET